jgi:hypothetical protein
MTTPPAHNNTAPPIALAPPRTLSILSLVAAVAAIPLGHFFVLPLAAIILGFYARSREPWARTMSTWGIVLGFVVLFWWVLVGVAALTFWAALPLLHWLH